MLVAVVNHVAALSIRLAIGGGGCWSRPGMGSAVESSARPANRALSVDALAGLIDVGG